MVHVCNDEETKAFLRFFCGQTHPTMSGPEHLQLDGKGGFLIRRERRIRYEDSEWISWVETKHPGTLLNNCGYEFWRKRYLSGRYDNNSTDKQKQVLERCALCPPDGRTTSPYDLSEWCLTVPVMPACNTSTELGAPLAHVLLFGVTEDVACTDSSMYEAHGNELAVEPYCRTLCAKCQVPICKTCSQGLNNYAKEFDVSTIPMALANDSVHGAR